MRPTTSASSLAARRQNRERALDTVRLRTWPQRQTHPDHTRTASGIAARRPAERSGRHSNTHSYHRNCAACFVCGARSSLAALSGFDLVAFTSANAVEAFQQRAQPLGSRLRHAASPWSALRQRTRLIRSASTPIYFHLYLPPNRSPKPSSRPYSAKFLPRAFFWCSQSRPQRHCAPRLQLRELEPPSPQHTATVYHKPRWRRSQPSSRCRRTALDAVTFTSASTARNLVALLEAAGHALPASVLRASIGPITSRALCDLGLPPHLEAAEPTLAALADVLTAYFQKDTNFQ